MDNKNFAIGILSTTATILFVGLVVIHTRPAAVLADGMTTRGGDYEMTVGAVIKRDEELVYIINTPRQRMIAYRFNANTNQIDVYQGVDLAEIRAQAGGKQQQPQRRGRRRP